MSYYGESRIVQVHPGRDLAVRHDVHVTHPRRMRLHGAQRVTQLLVVLKATRRDVLVCSHRGRGCAEGVSLLACVEQLVVLHGVHCFDLDVLIDRETNETLVAHPRDTAYGARLVDVVNRVATAAAANTPAPM